MGEHSSEDWWILLSRVLVGVLFLVLGVFKIKGIAGTAAYMQAAGIPAASVLVYAVIAVEILGGLMLITGFYSKIGAMVLALYLIPVTVLFHTKFADPSQMGFFLKNLAVMGGLIMLAVAGPGKVSLNEK